MELAAHLVSQILKVVCAKADVGVSLIELDKFAEEMILKQGGVPYNKGYHPKWSKTPYPATLCTNVNSSVAHGIPTDYKLQDGDIVNFDLGVKVGEFCGDAAITIPIGELSGRNERLLRYARRATYAGIDVCRAGVDVIEVGRAIQKYANLMGFVVNENMCGHGIGKEMHEKPMIPNFSARDDEAEKYTGVLKAGQVVCIEPMLTYKDIAGVLQPDGWTLKTGDGKNSAMFEHMVLITEEGHKVLTDHFEKEVVQIN